MLLATASFVVLAMRVKKEMRLFHYITSMVGLHSSDKLCLTISDHLDRSCQLLCNGVNHPHFLNKLIY